MKKQRKVLYFVTAVLLIVTVLVCIVQAGQVKNRPFSVEVSSGGKTERIDIWQREAGEYYVFLPGYTDLSQVRICLNTENAVSINGVPLEEGMCCDAFALDVPYEFAYTVWGKAYEHRITFLRSANVATMYIDTESGSMDYIHEKKGNEESGKIRLYTSDGSLDYAGAVEAINGRGNATWSDYEKKPYSLKLSTEADLLGLGKAQKWILLANAGDQSNLRNKISFDLAKTVDLIFSPDSQWTDLYLNGEYAGLYLLCERNEVHPERVDISENDSFLISLELESRLIEQNYTYVSTESKQALRVHYPQEASDELLATITDTVQSAENAMLAKGGIDPITGKSWSELIDVDSWARKYLVEEILANGDAGAVSQYFYFDSSGSTGKLYAGSVWDYDRTLGNEVGWQLVYPYTIYANRLQVNSNYSTPWLFYLYQKDLFYNRVVDLYETEFLPALDNVLNNSIHEYSAFILQASELNRIRWYDDGEDVFAHAEYIIDFMNERIAFLNRIWRNEEAYFRVRADQSFGSSYAYFIVFEGEHLTELPRFEDTETLTFQGWYYEDTDEPFDITKPITEDIEIYAKWAEKPSKRFGQIGKLIPLGVIAMIGVVLLIVDIKRMKRNR